MKDGKDTPRVEVVGYREDLLPWFERLTREWVESLFAIEETDLEFFRDPHGKIVAPGGQLFFVLEDGVVKGTCSVLPLGPKSYELAKMGVTPSARGRGLGDRLVQAAIEFARDRGAEEMRLWSNSRLSAALRLYEKYGFEVVPLTPVEHYTRVDVEMRLRLT